ncbi:MAG: glycosyltransferase, partial [Thermoanaerobaculia bacterium]
MSSRVAAIIPTLNEADSIAEVVAAAFSAGADEVIVSDGGSSDATRALAATAGARVLDSERVRGRQLNAGAKAATCDVLLFLHGDTLLPLGACRAAAESLKGGASFGGFRISFLESSWRLRLVAAMINARCALTRSPWGDQAQFISRDEFERRGGSRDWPI